MSNFASIGSKPGEGAPAPVPPAPDQGLHVTESAVNRIRAVMASDPEHPQLSASIGISIYSGHGERIEKLLSDADAQLYFEKSRRGKRQPAAIAPRRRAQKA